MARPRNKIADWLAYLGLRVGESLLHAMGFAVSYRLAALAGWLLYHFDGRHRRRALAHLRLSFPDWSEAQCWRVARRSFRSMVFMGMELLFTPRRITVATYRRHVRLREMSEAIRLMTSRRSPAILVTGHFGNWEVAGYMTAAVGLPTATVARHIDNPLLHEHILGVRQRAGQRIIDKKGAATEAAEVLAANGVLTFVADQDAGKKGLFVDYFGRKASTYKSIGLLAMLYRAPICVMESRRLDEGFHFEVSCRRVIRPEEWDAQDNPLRWITQEYTTALEQAARSDPGQYFWMHRRWKNRPRGEPRGQDGVA
ncbi:MAG TPA: lipid A biosynthesis acyltransferase [Phycisphaerales bacterium]|nr:lipid A biosynthesis acyltransferase [Phycisphaerales bacterium]